MALFSSRTPDLVDGLVDVASAIDAGLPAPDGGWLQEVRRRGGGHLHAWEERALEAADQAGEMPRTLRELAARRQEARDLRRSLLMSLAYPTLVLVGCVAVTALMATLGLALPTTWMLAAAALLAMAGAGVLLFLRALRQPDAHLERWPVFGPLALELAEVPYLQALHALYGAGVGVRDAHRVALQAAAVAPLRSRLEAAGAGLDAGEPLHVSLATAKALHGETRRLIELAEPRGELGDAILRAAGRRRERGGARARLIARGLGALVYAIAALAVAYLAASFYGGMYGSVLRR